MEMKQMRLVTRTFEQRETDLPRIDGISRFCEIVLSFLFELYHFYTAQ